MTVFGNNDNAISSPISLERFFKDVAIGGLTAGVINGVSALANGRNFLDGSFTKAATPASIPSIRTGEIASEQTKLQLQSSKAANAPLVEPPRSIKLEYGLDGQIVAKRAVQATEAVAPRTISSMSGHSVQQAITREFKSSDILKIVKEGNPVLAQGRYGAQWRYMLNGNTVVVNATKNRVITLFSNAPGTSNGLGAGLINLFK